MPQGGKLEPLRQQDVPTQHGEALQQPAPEHPEMQELAKLMVRQQNQLADLQAQVQGLQSAICKLDPAAPGCKTAG